LSESGKTTNAFLEKKNFQKAGEVLAEVWNSVEIDGHKVIAEYINPDVSDLPVPEMPNEEWYANHVRESQYMLQVFAIHA